VRNILRWFYRKLGLKFLFFKSKHIILSIIGKDVFYFRQTKCKTEFHGDKFEGWALDPKSISKDSIVYSIGVGQNIAFDISVINKYDTKIYAFDPTPDTVEWLKLQKIPPNYVFFKFGVASYDGVATFYPPKLSGSDSYSVYVQNTYDLPAFEGQVNSICTIMKKLGHNKIDILKMDIEGSEYDVLKDILGNNILVKQILIEFHHRFLKIGIEKTKEAIKMLNKQGYKIFWTSASGYEYSFIKDER